MEIAITAIGFFTLAAWVQSIAVFHHSVKTREMVRRLDAALLDFIEPGHRP